MHAARYYRGQKGPGKQVEDDKGDKIRDKGWRPVGGGDVQLDGRSAPGQVGGGESCVT